MMDKEIKEAEYFHVQNGPVLPSLLALRAYLRMIPKTTYEYHVNDQKNDFAAWVEHAFGETELGQRMRACKSREQMVWQLDDAFAEIRMAKVMADQEVVSKPQPVVQGSPDAADGVALQEDTAFDQQKGNIVATNERISAKYEDVARKMQEALLDPMPPDIEKRLEQLKSHQTEMLARISEARRQGHDALIPALVMRGFNAKFTYARVTRDEKDFKAVEDLLAQAQAELDEVLKTPEVNVKKEIMAMVEATEKKQA